MAEGMDQTSIDDTTIYDDTVEETESKEMVSELTALGNEFRRLLDPEVIRIYVEYIFYYL